MPLWPAARSPVQGESAGVRWWSFVLAGLAHAACMAMAFPPVKLWPVSFLAIVPLVWAGCRAGGRPVRTGLLAGLGVLPLWLFEQVWLVNVTAPGYPALCVYLALYAAVFVYLVGLARAVDWPLPMSLVVPVAWVGLEILRGEIVLTGYAFFLLGHPLIVLPWLAAPAAVLGAYSVSFLVAAIGGAFADSAAWSGLPRALGGIGAVVVLLVWAGLSIVGMRSLPAWPKDTEARGRSVRVAVVQTDVPQDNKIGWNPDTRLADWRRFVDLTKAAAAVRPAPDVIIWPETMFPGYALDQEAVAVERRAGLMYKLTSPAAIAAAGSAVIHGTSGVAGLPTTYFYDQMLKLQSEIGIPMVVGAIAADDVRTRDDTLFLEAKARYNSVFVIANGAVHRSRYDKVDLTPFGEVIPYLWRWPELQQKVLAFGAGGMTFDLSPGKAARDLRVPIGKATGGAGAEGGAWTLTLATPVCFEVTRTNLCRRLVDGAPGKDAQRGPQRADLLINVSNDGWFSFFDPGRAVHLLAARWRCVELGVPMVRAVNTGVSAVVSCRGRVVTKEVVPPPSAPPPVAAPGEKESDGWGQAGVLTATIPLRPDRVRTIYSRVGRLPDWVVVGLLGAGCIALWRRRVVLVRQGG